MEGYIIRKGRPASDLFASSWESTMVSLRRHTHYRLCAGKCLLKCDYTRYESMTNWFWCSFGEETIWSTRFLFILKDFFSTQIVGLFAGRTPLPKFSDIRTASQYPNHEKPKSSHPTCSNNVINRPEGVRMDYQSVHIIISPASDVSLFSLKVLSCLTTV